MKLWEPVVIALPGLIIALTAWLRAATAHQKIDQHIQDVKGNTSGKAQ